MKRLVFILVASLILTQVYPAGQKKGSIDLYNSSNFDDITVVWEYVHEDVVNAAMERESGDYASWKQDIGGSLVRCLDLEPQRRTAVVKPRESFELIGYYIHWTDVDKVQGIPLMKQLRSIYKKLEIRFPDGSVITLDTIGACMARKWVNAVFYIQICHPNEVEVWKPVEEI